MNKIKVKDVIRCIDLWTLNELTIPEAQKLFSEELENVADMDHWEDVRVSVGYADEVLEMHLVGYRNETDREYEARMKALRKTEEALEKQKQRDLATLARLKKKYETS